MAAPRLPARMKSWRFHAFGSVRDLRLDDIPVPTPAPEDCLVEVEYAALNPADRLLVMGRYPTGAQPPQSLGRDGCGIVRIPGATGRFAAGDRVVCLRSIIGIERDGTLAEYVAVPAAHLAPLPVGWPSPYGAAAPHALLTAWQALADVAALRAGETVVIAGASGGIGTAAVIIAAALGARVVALSRGADRRARLQALGAQAALATDDPALVGAVRALGGADVVVDTVGGAFLPQALEMANRYGRILSVGALGGTTCAIDPTQLIFKRLALHGVQVALYSDEGVQRAWTEVCRAVAPTGRRVPIDRVFAFEDVPAAFEHLRRGAFGKVVVGPIAGRGGGGA
jgi:NADPH:quinone reductase-like Zn-dependent oxidoreductase